MYGLTVTLSALTLRGGTGIIAIFNVTSLSMIVVLKIVEISLGTPNVDTATFYNVVLIKHLFNKTMVHV